MVIMTNVNPFRAQHVPCEIQPVAIVAPSAVCVVMIVVWATSMFDTVVEAEALGIGVLDEVEALLVDGVVIVLKFALPVPNSAEVPSVVAVNLLMGALAGVMLGVLSGGSIGDLVDVNPNASEFPMSTP